MAAIADSTIPIPFLASIVSSPLLFFSSHPSSYLLYFFSGDLGSRRMKGEGLFLSGKTNPEAH